MNSIEYSKEKLNDLYKERLILQMLGNQEPRAVCPEKYEHMRRMVEDFVHNKIDGVRISCSFCNTMLNISFNRRIC